MKKISFLLCAAVFTLISCGKTANQEQCATNNETKRQPVITVAFVNIDTLLSQYNLAKISNEKLIKKQEDARLKINSQTRQLQNEMQEFQRKFDNNAFLSRERAESEYARLQKKEVELQQLDRTLTQELLQEQQTLTQQLRDSIDAAITDINKEGKYELIISTSSVNDNVLFAKKQYDITNEVLESLNNRYHK
ncbi:MAG: OmpH family outer membrane protein [Paludibacteraceae bacterium]|jgi:outer membrane protein|nr:OmpH family outer membrane protein [Paludibacteraceae bacterium]